MKWLSCLFMLATVASQNVGIPRNISSPNPCTDANHMLLAPGVFAAGGTSRACVSRFYTEGPARLTLALHTPDGQRSAAVRELPPGDGGCLDISVPLLPNTKADFIVSVRYPSQCTWSRSTPVRLGGARVIAVAAERARYRPGDAVRARVLALRADFSAAHGVIEELSISSPGGTPVAVWRGVRIRLGAAQAQHTLDTDAPPGRWTVAARMADGSQGSTSFFVGAYDLPPFQLSVRHSPRVLRSSERLVWVVCVRYPWTEAVEGMLVIRIRGVGAPGVSGIRTAVRLRAPRACHRHAAAAKRIGLDAAVPPDVVVADFSFQEEGTRIWQNTTVVSQVVDKAVTLEFLTRHRTVISPGLPYKLKVKATRWDEKPSPETLVRVCRTPISTPDVYSNSSAAILDCEAAYTDSTGVAKVMFKADQSSSPFYKMQAFLRNETTPATDPLLLPVARPSRLHAALGPLRVDSLETRTFVPLYLSSRNITNAVTVHFVVITRGGIIYRWGASTQCPLPNAANRIQTALRNSPCNLAQTFPSNLDQSLSDFDRNDTRKYPGKEDIFKNTLDDYKIPEISDALMDRQMLRVMLPIKVTHQMCPDSHMIAYFYHNGELVSASKHFEMEECFGNKVEATWLNRQVAPGSQATLKITTAGPAHCMLSAQDVASKWLQPTLPVKDILVRGLKRIMDSNRNLTEYDAAGECFLTADTPDVPTSSMDLLTVWLAAGGIRLLGGGNTRLCRPPVPAMMMDENEVGAARSDFSESWLWISLNVSANGTAAFATRAPDSVTRHEAAAVCVSRLGVSVSPPAVLQVFREFFLHADIPKLLKRGDSTILRYRLFNYLYEPLSVQLDVTTDSHLEGPVGTADRACVGARSSIVRRVEVKAKAIGSGNIRIRAISVNDGACSNITKSRPVSDEVILQVTVEAEGVIIRDTKSMVLCGNGSAESSQSMVSWSWPAVEAAAGSERLTAWALADLAGPLLADADSLIVLPRGCGEQNMARLALNLLALGRLRAGGAARAAAREHVARGFTRQLQYAHPAGGFSAFGANDLTPSTWLTAFVLRYIETAYETLSPSYPPPPALGAARRWLLARQTESGCFRNEGQVFHRELKGGLNEDGEIASVALTAYVITSLTSSTTVLPSKVIRNALSCLRALPPTKANNPNRVYAQSLLAYTFMKLKSYEDEIKKGNEASLLDRRKDGLRRDEEMKQLMELLKMAKRSEDYVWWETGSLPTSIEATGYALLALSYCPEPLRETCGADARGAVRWLNTHRNEAGGFITTQDTLVAVEALVRWSSIQPSTPASLHISLTAGGARRGLAVRGGEPAPRPERLAGRELAVSVDGVGCALIQVTRSYNTESPPVSLSPLSAAAAVRTDGGFDCRQGAGCYCAAVVEACVVWAGAFPEMALLEVALPSGFAADAARLYAQLATGDELLRRIELNPTNSRATLYLGTRDGSDAPGRGGHQCYSVHAVGPRARTKPGHVKVYDYYRPALGDTQMYTIPEECPSKIAQDTEKYTASDNLFDKAKSLDGEGEIIITNDFFIDDVPEGIPLEDPLYENLKERSPPNETKNGDINVQQIEEKTDINYFANRRMNYDSDPVVRVSNSHKDKKDKRDPKAKAPLNYIRNDSKESNTNTVARKQRTRKKSNHLEQNENKNVSSSNSVRRKDTHNSKVRTPIIDDKILKLSEDRNTVDLLPGRRMLSEPEPIFFNNDMSKTVPTKTDSNSNTEKTNSEDKSIYFNTDSIKRTSMVEEDGKLKCAIPNLKITSQQTELNDGKSEQMSDIPLQTSSNEQNDRCGISTEHKIEIRDESNPGTEVFQDQVTKANDEDKSNKEVGNPNLADFHVIDSVKDLEVPTGIEGPIPSVVLPPPNMFNVKNDLGRFYAPPHPTVHTHGRQPYTPLRRPALNSRTYPVTNYYVPYSYGDMYHGYYRSYAYL